MDLCESFLCSRMMDLCSQVSTCQIKWCSIIFGDKNFMQVIVICICNVNLAKLSSRVYLPMTYRSNSGIMVESAIIFYVYGRNIEKHHVHPEYSSTHSVAIPATGK